MPSSCELITQESGALHSTSCFILSNAALNASLSASDHKYPQFYVVNVAPVLGTTQQWRSFWETLVPDLSSYDSSVYHAMVALSAVFESKVSGTDHSIMVMHQVNLAVRAAYSQSVCTCNMLILCRLLASISQCTGDRKMAVNHLQHGWKILVSAIGDCQLDPNIMRLLAPTFLCASRERVSSLFNPLLGNLYAQSKIECLESIRLDFLKTLSLLDPTRIESRQKSFLVACWNVMTQASSCLVFPDTSSLVSDDGIFTVHEMEKSLREAEELLNLEQLQQSSASTFRLLEMFIQCGSNSSCSWGRMQQCLELFVQNFLVQVAEIQPNIRTGPFWYDDQDMPCAIEEFSKSLHEASQINQNRGILAPNPC